MQRYAERDAKGYVLRYAEGDALALWNAQSQRRRLGRTRFIYFTPQSRLGQVS